MTRTAYSSSNDIGSVDNVVAVWQRLSESERQEARMWYRTARQDCIALATEMGLDYITVIKVVSVISPQRNWQRNIADARTLLLAWQQDAHDYEQCRIPLPSGWLCVRKAYAILNGTGDLSPTAPKTWAFFWNIHKPSLYGLVTIDSHAQRLWRGDKKAGTIQFTPKVYRTAEADFMTAGNILGEMPQDIQAGTWGKRKEELAA